MPTVNDNIFLRHCEYLRLKPAVSENVKQSKSEFVNNSNNKATLVPCVFIFELLTQWASHRDAERKPHCC